MLAKTDVEKLKEDRLFLPDRMQVSSVKVENATGWVGVENVYW